MYFSSLRPKHPSLGYDDDLTTKTSFPLCHVYLFTAPYKESLDPSLPGDRQWSQIIVTLLSMPTLSHYWAPSLASIGEWNGRQRHRQVSQRPTIPISGPCLTQNLCSSGVQCTSPLLELSCKAADTEQGVGTWGMEVFTPSPILNVTAPIF